MKCLIIGIRYIYPVKLLKGHAFNKTEMSRVNKGAHQMKEIPGVSGIMRGLPLIWQVN
jgi:hypothetical protein